MPYYTVSLKLLTPTTSKKQQLDQAMDRYAMAFERLLRCIKNELHEGSSYNKMDLTRLVNEYLPMLDDLGIQPFKDALKRDVVKTVHLYLVQKQKRKHSRYPMLQSNSEDLKKRLDSGDLISAKNLDFWLDRYQKRRPLLFCRYSETRNYALLYDAHKDRYYAKLYLFNAQQAKRILPITQGNLQYVTSKKTLKQSNRPYCYQLCPLVIGTWQKQHLTWLEEKRAVAKSAELVERNGDYFLNVRLWIEPKLLDIPKMTLGVCRGIEHTVCYALCSEQGQTLRTGYLQENADEEMEKRLLQKILALSQKHHAQIVLANLVTRNDRLDTFASPQLSVRSYNRLVAKIRYQTELQGMPPAIVVSARGLFSRCPECGTIRQENRMNDRIFLCTCCGHVEQLETVGAENLASKLAQYRKDKLTIYYEIQEKKIIFSLPQIDFLHCTGNGPKAKESCILALKEWMETQEQGAMLPSVQKNIYQKLKHTCPMEDALQFVYQ